MLTEIFGFEKKIVIANFEEVADDRPKSFLKVFEHIISNQNSEKNQRLSG